MDESALLRELRDRHADHLVYEGPYRLLRDRRPAQAYADVARLFADWRQRIYHFDNELGASVVLYRPVHRARLRWDLVSTHFLGDDPFAFHTRGGVRSDLAWPQVQQLLDSIRSS